MNNKKTFFAILILAFAGLTVFTLRGFNNSGEMISGQSVVRDQALQDELVASQESGVFTGCIESCQYSDASCGECYCLKFDRGCPKLSQNPEFKNLVGKKVKLKGTEGIFGTPNCASFLTAEKIEVIGTC